MLNSNRIFDKKKLTMELFTISNQNFYSIHIFEFMTFSFFKKKLLIFNHNYVEYSVLRCKLILFVTDLIHENPTKLVENLLSLP